MEVKEREGPLGVGVAKKFIKSAAGWAGRRFCREKRMGVPEARQDSWPGLRHQQKAQVCPEVTLKGTRCRPGPGWTSKSLQPLAGSPVTADSEHSQPLQSPKRMLSGPWADLATHPV